MNKENEARKVGKGGKRRTVLRKKNRLRPELVCFRGDKIRIELRLEFDLAYLAEEGANLL